MAKALFYPAPNKLEWREVPDRAPGPGEVRVKTEFATMKHGTELTYFKGLGDRNGRFDPEYNVFRKDRGLDVPFPRLVGNMAAGLVTEAAPDVTTYIPGDCIFFLRWFPGCLHHLGHEGWRPAVL